MKAHHSRGGRGDAEALRNNTVNLIAFVLRYFIPDSSAHFSDGTLSLFVVAPWVL
jgi:hypothetical protein